MSSDNNNKTNGNSVRLVKDSSGGTYTVPLIFNDLCRAYAEARRHKRWTHSQLRFESHLECNLYRLSCELHGRTYRTSPSVCFINELPVKREVVAADFRDRVVHHLLCSWLFPIYERRFIQDCYSCRKGKGTLYGINRVRGFLRSASDDFRKDCWVLKLDVRGFFMSIYKDTLYGLVMKGVDDSGFLGVPDPELCEFLVRAIVYADPVRDAVFRSPPSAWDGLPTDKSLMFSGEGRGLPIGNLTSQLFGNIYLNPLDQYVKRELGVRYYGRYVDDMVLVGNSREELAGKVEPIRSFLRDRLGLTLHPKKIMLQPASYGFPFLGVYIKPYHVLPTRRLRRNSLDALYGGKAESIASYLGYYTHLNGLPEPYDAMLKDKYGIR